MKIVGLTGSIGMGKSTVLAMFDECGVPVFSADTAVHNLYAKNGRGVDPVSKRFPDALKDGTIDRKILAAAVLNDRKALGELEAIVHPLVGDAQTDFVERSRQQDQPLVVLEIPLLFETGAGHRLDATVVVSALAHIQRARVLARPGMTEDKFKSILARQTPDAEKRKRADYVIDTGQSLEDTRKVVDKLINTLAPVRPQR